MAAARRVVCFGECMIELQGPAFGTLRQTHGGDTYNTAVYLARCAPALRTAYASAVGDDALSAQLLERWQADGVQTDLVRQLAGRLPGLYQISVDERGERRFSYWRNESAARAYFEAPSTPLEDAADEIDALYFSGISLAILPLAGRERLFALAERLAARGATVAFDNNYRPRLWADAATARAAFDRACALASVALLTLDDEVALRGDAALTHAFALRCRDVVVKRGPEPTLVRDADGAVHEVATEPVPRVVDTTAAGDSFAGAWLAARLTGADARAAAAAGNRLAARVVQHPGAVIPADAMADLAASAPGAGA
jgi:2-dehydro-3-deoxygluconokinase